MRSKRLLLLAVALLILFGCSTKKQRTIAVIPKGTAQLFWVSIEQGARQAGKEFGVEILWSGPATETEYSRQLEIFDSMVNRKVDGIAVAAIERKVLVDALERARQANIPVTIFDSGADSENYISFVATNNYEAGKLGARTLAELIHGKGKVGVVGHTPGSFSTVERERGFTDAITKEFPGIKIVATQFSMADPAKGMAVAENIMTAHPDLAGIFASSEPSSLGVSQAIKARNVAGKVRFVAFDRSDGLDADTKAGVIDAMVVQDPVKLGYEAVRTVVDKLNGKTPERRIDLNAKVITKKEL